MHWWTSYFKYQRLSAASKHERESALGIRFISALSALPLGWLISSGLDRMKYSSIDDRNCVCRSRTNIAGRFYSLWFGKRTRSLNCVETARNINSEDHKGVSGIGCWHLIEIQRSCPAEMRYMVGYQIIIWS